VITTSGASSVIASAILACSSGVLKIWLSGKSQNSTSSTPTIADDVRCSRSRSGPVSSGDMPEMPTSPRHASA